MPICGFNEKMLKGLVLFAQGLYEVVQEKAQERGVSIEQGMEQEIHEMNVFLPALDEEYERLRETKGVDEAMRALVKWAAQYGLEENVTRKQSSSG